MASEAGAECWDWALAIYARGRVSAICLELQDAHDQCVSLLLWAAWLGTKRLVMQADMAAVAADMAHAWTGQVLEPVRKVRRCLKEPISGMEDGARLRIREQIKALELEAEHQLMLGLADLEGAESGLSTTLHCLENALLVARNWSSKVPRAVLIRFVEEIESCA